MSDEPVFCVNCDHMSVEKNTPPHRAYCLKHRRHPRYGFVTPNEWHTDQPPYLRCADVNAGFCPLYAPKRTPQMELEA